MLLGDPLVLPSYATDPAAPNGGNGLIWNSTAKAVKFWDGSAWQTVGTGSGSGSAVDASPIGTIRGHAGSSIPSGYLLCDGSAVSRSTYAALFATIGTSYGTGDGSTTFNLPDLRARSMVGANATTLTGRSIRSLGTTGGEEAHTLTIAEMPSHDHDIDFSFDAQPGSGQARPYGANTGPSLLQTRTRGGGAAHNTMPPFAVVNFIIKAVNQPFGQPLTNMPTVPACKAYLAADTATSNTVTTSVSMTGEIYDTDNIHDTVTNPTRFTCRTPGVYQIDANAWFAGSTGGTQRIASLLHISNNGVSANIIADQQDTPSAADSRLQLSATVMMAAGDWIELQTYQDSGGALNVKTLGALGRGTSLAMTWLGEGRGIVGEQPTSYACLQNNAAQTIADNGGWTAVAFNTKVVDNDNMTTTANQLTIRTPGVYTFIFNWIQSSGAGERYARIKQNGTEIARTMLPAYSGDSCGAPLIATVPCNIGDAITVDAGSYQKGSASSLSPGIYTQLSAIMETGLPKAVIPHARVRRSANQTIGNAVWVRVSIDQPLVDNDGIFDAANNRLIIKTPGVYTLASQILWKNDGASGTGLRCLSIRKNGVSVAETRGVGIAGNWLPQSCSVTMECSIGDIIETYVEQESGGNVSISVEADPKAELGVTKIGLSGQAGVAGGTQWAANGTDIQPTNAGQVRFPNGIYIDAWQNLVYSNGWQDYAQAPWATGQVRKYPDGRVLMRGLLKKPAGNWIGGETVATIPVGLRPLFRERFIVAGQGNGSEGQCTIDALPTGELLLITGGPANPVDWLTISNCTWSTT